MDEALFARLAATGSDAGVVPDFLERKYRDARLGPRGRTLVEAAIVALLAVRDETTGRSAVLVHLETVPEHRDRFTRLWSIVLRANGCRRQALDALLDGVRDLPTIAAEPEMSAVALGVSFARTMSPPECRLLAGNLGARHRQRIGDGVRRRGVRNRRVSARTAERAERVDELVQIVRGTLLRDYRDRW